MSVGAFPSEIGAAAGVAGLRAAGLLRIRAGRIAGQTVANDIDEEGPLRVRFPRIASEGVLEGVLVNTGGGIVGGDRLRFDIDVDAGAKLALTSPASEKIYRSGGEEAAIAISLRAGPRASLAWLPQESILFDRAHIVRRIDAEAAPDATLTICESIVFGRTAMGESVMTGAITDRWNIRRDGKLVLAEALRLGGAVGETLARPAIARGALGAATVVQLAPDAETKIDAVRAALELQEVEAGASAFDGLLVVRMLAADSIGLRATILATLSALGAPPPRAYSL